MSSSPKVRRGKDSPTPDPLGQPEPEAKPLNWQARYPSAFWELVELTLAGVPEASVKAFRRGLVIGKGKRLSASQANAAIGGAHVALGKVHKREPDEGSWHERQVWYAYNQLNVVVVQEWADELTERDEAILSRARRVAYDNHVQLTMLVWDEEGVDRTVVTVE